MDALVGEPIDVLIPSDRHGDHAGHLQRFFEAPRSRQMGDGLDLAGRHRDGTDFAVEVSFAPVEVRGGRYAAAFVRDGRERRRVIDRANTVSEITQRILAGSAASEIMPLVTARARRLSRSEAAWVVTPDPSGKLVITSVDGPGSEVLLGVTLSAETSRSSEVMRAGRSEAIDDLSSVDNVPSEVRQLGLGPGLYVPLIASERRHGALVLARARGDATFSPVDIAFAEVFASAIATAIENGEVRAELERLGLASEHERIGLDLHDTVIQQLFSVGMSLQAARATLSGRGVEKVDAAVESLDAIIREIRNTIFRLPARTDSAKGLRDEMFRIGDKYADELGFTPRFVFHGPVDASVPENVAQHLLQVLTEGLSNIARHAHAKSAEAIVTVEDGWVTLTLLDDGIGITEGPNTGLGLSNMSRRATSLGGTCVVARRDPSGTSLLWRAPI